MLTWKSIVQDYITKNSNKIKKTTQPLRERFGIEYFTYHKIDKDGRYTVLVDRPDWAEYYVNEKLFLIDPYLRNYHIYKSGVCFAENNGSEEYKKKITHLGKTVLNIDSNILIINKKTDFVEFFGFSGNKKTSALEKVYLNHSKLLKKFSFHFKVEMNSLLSNMNEESNFLYTLKGKDFFFNQTIDPNIDLNSKSHYLKDIGIHLDYEPLKLLSKREKECLKYLFKNKSAKETASLLALSPRTVEFYFENIKNKLSCNSKKDLLSMLKKFDHLDLNDLLLQ